MRFVFSVIALILTFLLGCFTAVYNFLFPEWEVAKIRENLGMNIKPYYVEFSEDDKGWFGDGESIIIFTPNPEQKEKILSEWSKTPVEKGISSLIFPENEYNGLELAGYIPKTEGFWFFRNRNKFSDGYSFNFSFALFDGEKVYYYELDT